jgi:hypothetical protein
VTADGDVGDVAITGSTAGSVHALLLRSFRQHPSFGKSQDRAYDTRRIESKPPGVDDLGGCLVGVITGPRPDDRVSGVTCRR